jgi:hypothetical protein
VRSVTSSNAPSRSTNTRRPPSFTITCDGRIEEEILDRSREGRMRRSHKAPAPRGRNSRLHVRYAVR